MRIFLLLFVYTLTINGQDIIKDLNIFYGKWKSEDKNMLIFEEWQKNNDTSFSGEGYFFKNGEKIITEKLYLLKLHDQIVYIAKPGKNDPTLFTLTEYDPQKFIFENPEHDFPKKITYEFINDSTLNAFIEGEMNAEKKVVKFSLKRIK